MVARVCEMVAEVCKMIAGVAQCTLEFAQVALEFVAGRYRVPEKASRNKPKTCNLYLRKFQNCSRPAPKHAHPVLHAGTLEKHAARLTPGSHVLPRGSWGFPTAYFKATSETLQNNLQNSEFYQDPPSKNSWKQRSRRSGRSTQQLN